MKKTVKQWCKEYGFDWYGPGVKCEHQYDYKILYRSSEGSSVVAHFSATYGSEKKPINGKKKKGDFLLVPVYSQVTGDKEMSRRKFKSASNWVQDCLSGNISEYSKKDNHLPEAPETNMTVNQSAQVNPCNPPENPRTT